MKVLITGVDGFIDFHLTEMLAAKECQVKALSQYNSFNNWGWIEELTYNESLFSRKMYRHR
jgi:nucleoside-diphosphate-sugar epimerase